VVSGRGVQQTGRTALALVSIHPAGDRALTYHTDEA